MEIVQLPVPTTLDEPAATDFVATVAVRNEVQNLILGAEAGTFSAEELLPNWTDPYSPKRLFAGRVDGRRARRAVPAATRMDARAGRARIAVATAGADALGARPRRARHRHGHRGALCRGRGGRPSRAELARINRPSA